VVLVRGGGGLTPSGGEQKTHLLKREEKKPKGGKTIIKKVNGRMEKGEKSSTESNRKYKNIKR